MARDLQAKVAGAWDDATALFTKVGGVWSYAKTAWVKRSGTWMQFYPADPETNVYTTPGTTSVVVPMGHTTATISVYGAGGGGGPCDRYGASIYSGGGGGSGGYITSYSQAVVPGTTLEIVVPSGGAGGSNTGPTLYDASVGGSVGGTAQVQPLPNREWTIQATGGSGSPAQVNYGGYGGAGGSPSGVAGGNGSINGLGGAGGSNGTGYGTGGTGSNSNFSNGNAGSNGRVVVAFP